MLFGKVQLPTDLEVCTHSERKKQREKKIINENDI